MDTKFTFDGAEAPSTAKRIVYVKPVAVTDLPADVQGQAMGAQEVYAVHAESGERLALVRDRNLAFMLARQNDLAPVNVH